MHTVKIFDVFFCAFLSSRKLIIIWGLGVKLPVL